MKILKNYLLNIILVINNIFFPIILFPYISRVLTPLYFGKYNFVTSIANYFITLACLGVPTYGVRELIQKKIKGKEELKKSFSEIFYITFISSLIATILYLFFIKKFNYFEENRYLFYIIGLNIISSFLMFDYYFIAFENHKRRTIRRIIVRMISLFFIFAYVKESKDYLKFAIIITIPEIAAKLLDFFMLKKLINYNLKELNLKQHLKPLIIIFIYIFLTTIYLNIDSTMLGLMRTQIEVGYYNVGIKMTKIAIPLITSLGLVMSPRMIVKIKENNIEGLIKDMNINLNFIFFLSLPIIGVLYLTADEIIIIFSGKEYLKAIIPMKIMLLIILFISISNFCASQILIPMGYENKVLKIAIIGGMSNIVLNYILIPLYGVLGASLGTLLSEGIVCILRIMELKKIVQEFRIFNKERYKYLIAIFFTVFFSILIKEVTINNIFLKLIIIYSFFSGVYLQVLFIQKEYFILKFVSCLKKRRLKFEN